MCTDARIPVPRLVGHEVTTPKSGDIAKSKPSIAVMTSTAQRASYSCQLELWWERNAFGRSEQEGRHFAVCTRNIHRRQVHFQSLD